MTNNKYTASTIQQKKEYATCKSSDLEMPSTLSITIAIIFFAMIWLWCFKKQDVSSDACLVSRTIMSLCATGLIIILPLIIVTIISYLLT